MKKIGLPGGATMTEDHPCVCVVDDDQSMRESLRDLLCSMGLNVQTFASAHDFLTKPFRDEDLLTAVAQALHRARLMGPGPHPPATVTPAAAEDRRSERHF